jgi:hypothetical protein
MGTGVWQGRATDDERGRGPLLVGSVPLRLVRHRPDRRAPPRPGCNLENFDINLDGFHPVPSFQPPQFSNIPGFPFLCSPVPSRSVCRSRLVFLKLFFHLSPLFHSNNFRVYKRTPPQANSRPPSGSPTLRKLPTQTQKPHRPYFKRRIPASLHCPSP